MSSGPRPRLFDEIEAEISRHRSLRTIKIAITPEPEDFTDPDTGDVFLVKWLSWNLLDSQHRPLTDPKLEVVGDWITEEQIRIDLAEHFPGLEGIVDNSIRFTDD